MNSKKLQYLAFVAILSLMGSCTKFEVPEKKIGTTQNFKELKVEESFEWKTTQNIELKVTGLETISPVRANFSIKNHDGNLILEESRLMSESFDLNLEIPVTEKKIIVQFGSLLKEIEINSNKLIFEYITARPAEITEE
jgi:hypothetical protein